MLAEILGPVVEKLALGLDPDGVSSSSDLLATLFQYFNSGLLIVGSFIVGYVAIVGAINTANDGEALGKSWSSLWTPVRAVVGSAALLPTATGFSFIQLAVMTLVLWGIGFANSIYRLGMTESVLAPNAVVSGVHQSGAFYGLRDFAKDYLKVTYCAQSANALWPGADVRFAVSEDPPAQSAPGAKGTFYYMKDWREGNSNLAGGKPFCGTLSLWEYENGSSDPGMNHTDQLLQGVKKTIQDIKVKHTRNMMDDLDRYVDDFPKRKEALQNASGTLIESKKFNDIVAEAEEAIIDEMRLAFEGSGSESTTFNAAMKDYMDLLVKEGWAMAGGWYQRVGAVRSTIVKELSRPVGAVAQPDYVGLPDVPDPKRVELVGLVETFTQAVISKADDGNIRVAAGNKPTFEFNLPEATAKMKFRSNVFSWINGQTSAIIDLTSGSEEKHPCGSAGVMGGHLNRLKCAGDMMIISAMKAESAVDLHESTRAAFFNARDSLYASYGADMDRVAASRSVIDVSTEHLKDYSFWLKGMAFYFSTFLPALPYMIFVIVVVGWILAVLQSLIAAPLWALMHLTPERTFVGSQRQGYLLLLALFARPALAVIGLFAAFLIANPVLAFITKAFFSMREAVVASSGTALRSSTEYRTFFWWFFIYGALLMPVLYMVFSLPQMLPDKVLKWIGAGVEDLGETNALAETRGTMMRGAAVAAGAAAVGSMDRGPGVVGQGLQDRGSVTEHDNAGASKNSLQGTQGVISDAASVTPSTPAASKAEGGTPSAIPPAEATAKGDHGKPIAQRDGINSSDTQDRAIVNDLFTTDERGLTRADPPRRMDNPDKSV
jgi:conjugal transfer/type IV secretion protein DotA/TraY